MRTLPFSSGIHPQGKTTLATSPIRSYGSSGANTQESLLLSVKPGSTYYVVVDTVDGNKPSSYSLGVTCFKQ